MPFFTDAEREIVGLFEKVYDERRRLQQDPAVERAEQEAHAAAADLLQPLVQALGIEPAKTADGETETERQPAPTPGQ